MKVVITGAVGLLGKVATQALVDAGHEVVAVDRFSGVVPEGVPLHIGDLTDINFARHVIGNSEAVVHLGAIPNPLSGKEYEVFQNNVSSAFAVFNAAADAKCRVVAYASSVSAYGTAWSPKWTSPLYAPIDEAHPFVYSESYALSKHVNELSALTWSRRSDTSYVGFRFPYTNSAEKTMAFAKSIKSGAEPDVLTAAKILWGYLDSRDAAAALELTIRSDLKGAHVFNFAAPDTFMTETTDKLFARYHPTTVLKSDFSGYQAAVSSDHWIKTMGYVPRYLIDRAGI
jgi:nucleoside-diphosphate-sugar epimerase